MKIALRISPRISVILAALALPFGMLAQSEGPDSIFLGSPSFEDIPRAGGSGYPLPIMGWVDCGATLFPSETPPDIHPVPGAAWGVSKPAEDGATYLGMVVRDDETWESLSQAMSAQIKGGECYEFSAWLCRSERYMSPRRNSGDSIYPFDKPAVLRIYGGRTFCDQGELLAESPPVVSHDWQQVKFRFEPVRDHKFIMIQAFYKTPVLAPYNGHVLVDHLSPIVRVPCNENEIVLDKEEENVIEPVNTKPPPAPSHSTVTKKPPVADPPPVPVETPKLLSELDRQKLHQGKTIRIEKLYFKADSSNFQADSYPVLDEIASFMIKNPDVIIEIGGHTNTKPSPSYCDRLSTARAKSVMDYLVSKGVPREQLQYKGYGKNKPLVQNDWYDRNAQAKNQRVELKILSMGKG